MATKPAAAPNYDAPALSKGLDILECLAALRVPLTQAQLARALRRTPSELFRMLDCLERRGYIAKEPSGAYALTLKLFELGHTHSPHEQLVRAAAAPMRAFAMQVRESCHLGVLRGGELLVLAQAEGPDKLRLSVEVGATFPVLGTVSGRLLTAYLGEDELAQLGPQIPGYTTRGRLRKEVGEQLRSIRRAGYATAHHETVVGVNDVAVLVGSPHSVVRSALTCATLKRSLAAMEKEVLPALRQCAAVITREAGLLAGADDEPI